MVSQVDWYAEAKKIPEFASATPQEVDAVINQIKAQDPNISDEEILQTAKQLAPEFAPKGNFSKQVLSKNLEHKLTTKQGFKDPGIGAIQEQQKSTLTSGNKYNPMISALTNSAFDPKGLQDAIQNEKSNARAASNDLLSNYKTASDLDQTQKTDARTNTINNALDDPQSPQSQILRSMAEKFGMKLPEDLPASQSMDIVKLLKEGRKDEADIAYKQAMLKAKINTATLSPYDKSKQTSQAKSDVEFGDAYSKSKLDRDQTVRDITRMKELIDSGKINTDGTAGIATDVAGERIGNLVKSAEEREYDQLFNKLQLKVAQGQKGQGAFTDFERRLFASTIPGREKGAQTAGAGLGTLLGDLQAGQSIDDQRYSKLNGTSAPEAAPSTEKVLMISPDGKTGYVAKDKVKEAEASGYKVK